MQRPSAAPGTQRPGTFPQPAYPVVGAAAGKKKGKPVSLSDRYKQATTLYDIAKTTAGVATKLGVKLPPALAWLNPEKPKVDDAKPSGPKQYHLAAVPAPDTKVNLGEWVKQPELAGLGAPFGYPGYSLSTAANYFASAGGQSVFQGTGNVTFQSAATWTQRAIDWDATTRTRVRITSGKELILSSGTASAPEAKEMAIGSSGAKLEPPRFDEADLVSLMLDHATDDLKNLLDTTLEATKTRLKLGRKSLPVPELTVWKRLGLFLHAMKKKLDAVAEKIKAVREKLEAGAKYAKLGADYVAKHKAEMAAGYERFDEGMESFHAGASDYWAEHGTAVAVGGGAALGVAAVGAGAYALHRRGAGGAGAADAGAGGAASGGAASGSAPAGGTPAGGEAKPAGGEAKPAAKDPPPAKFKTKALSLEDAKTAASYLSQAVDEAKGQVARNQKRYDEAEKAFEEGRKARDAMKKEVAAIDDPAEAIARGDKLLANMAKMMASGAKVLKAVEEAVQDLGKALDRFAYDMAIGKGKPKMHLVAKHDLEVGTSERFHAYAKKGFNLQADGGGLVLHTQKEFAVRAMENSEVSVKKSLTLESGLGAELASYGPVSVGSRQDDVELLGEHLYVGTLTAATSYRKHRQFLIGGAPWDDGKQKATKTLHAMATDAVYVQAGGEKPKGEKAKLEEATPFYLSADKDGKVTLHAKKGGLVRIQIGKFAIEMSEHDLTIGLANSETATPGKAVFGVDANGGICMMNEAGTCSFDDKSGAFKLRSGSAKVILKGSGTKIDGQKINIG